MKTFLIAVLSATVALVSGIAFAQEEAEGPRFYPVETFTCNYNEGKGPADMEKAIDAWSKFLNKKEVTTYWAATVTPYYFGAETFDIGWLGAWTNGEAMGAGTDMWLSEGGEHAEKFAAAVTCDTHSNFASTEIKAPPEGPSPDNIVITFSDCNVHDGKAFPEVLEASNAWAEYQVEAGYEGGSWMLFPVFGGGGAEFDFKMVESFENYTVLGQFYDLYGNGGGYQKHGELIGELYECDDARVYNATIRRRIPAPAE
ncbi:MAG: hypothetical protein OER97_00620 [Gammaproteobacteria bacterium]|nr:hypothetical protein [Gammaproteobacteria bacterium]